MKFEYRLNLKDYQEADEFRFRSHKTQYAVFWIFAICMILIAIFLLFFVDIYNGIFWIILAIFLNPEGMIISSRFFASLAWKQQAPSVREPIEIEVLEEGLTSESISHKSLARWSCFTKFIETPNLFILDEEEMLIQIVPKRAFECNDQIQEFKALLNEKVRSSTRSKSK